MKRLCRLGLFGAPIVALSLLSHCGGSELILPAEPPISQPPGAFRIEPIDGDNQSGVVGTMLTLPLSVKVTDSLGDPVESVTVRWAAANGGSVSAVTSTTNAEGTAQVLRTLGPTPGPYATQAEATGLSGSPVLFRANAIPVGPQPPIAADDEYDTIEGFSNILRVEQSEGVLRNDVDPEGETLTATSASNPPNGHVTLSPDGSFSYNPEVNFFGDDQFTYRARDPDGESSTATVTIHVAPVNDAPFFSDKGDPSRVDETDGPRSIDDWARDISPGADNETDQVLEFQVVGNSNPLLFTSDGQPAVTRNGPQSDKGALTFTPSGITGEAIITVVLKDNGGTASGGGDTSGSHTFMIRVGH